jgi:hypothetical protein
MGAVDSELLRFWVLLRVAFPQTWEACRVVAINSSSKQPNALQFRAVGTIGLLRCLMNDTFLFRCTRAAVSRDPYPEFTIRKFDVASDRPIEQHSGKAAILASYKPLGN